MPSFVVSNFESESATGFVYEVIAAGYGLIGAALEKINNEPGLLECEEALVAAELVAAAIGNPAHDIPEQAAEWVTRTFLPDGGPYLEMIALTDRAADAIDAITADSELREFWEDTAEFESWMTAQVNLQNRLLGD